ncbi:GNAT family N-acetyltransferase [Devosia sp.]|uniref:GNAT family N-acetyltransferase n=1 Tax=Devosia sp. TaxID=1871048 RepID=UPI00326726D9
MTNWSRDLTTYTGFTFHVRPVRPDDEPALARFFEHVTPDDLRFRFLSTIRSVGHDRLVTMTQVDHHQTESFVAQLADDGPIIATALLACDAKLDVGEVAISIVAEHKHKGIGWELLGHVTRYARARGVKSLQSVESRSNHVAIDLEKELGFTAESYAGDASLVVLRKVLQIAPIGSATVSPA